MAWHGNFNVDVWIGIITFTGLCYMIMVMAFLFLIYQFMYKTKMYSMIKFYSLAGLSCFIISQIFHLLYVIFVKLPNGKINGSTKSFWACYNTFWSLAYFFTYLLMFDRIRITFKNSAYRFNTIILIIFYILLSCYLIVQTLNSLVWELLIFSDGSFTWNEYNFYYHILLWTRTSVDFLLNVYIIYLFCSKMYKVTVKKGSFVTVYSPKMFETMVKYFLLTLFTVLSTQLFTASEILLSQSITNATETDKFRFYYASYSIYYIMGNIDSIISTLYIILTFPFSKQYYKKCCKCAHNGCLHIWSKDIIPAEMAEAQQKIVRVNSVENDDEIQIERKPLKA